MPIQTKNSDQIPATLRHLEEAKYELKKDITSLRLETKSGFKKVDARFTKMEANFLGIDARFKNLDAHFGAIAAQFSKMESALFAIKSMFEEQNSRNRFVLDGYTSIYDTHEDMTSRLENLEVKVFGIKQK